MTKILIALSLSLCLVGLLNSGAVTVVASTENVVPPSVPDIKTSFNVRDFGAKGNAKTVDSPAINKAIDAASAAGGGTVYFPAGNYLSFSIRLKSNITLFLDNGATILAADPKEAGGTYDMPEPSDFDMYQ